MEKNGKAVAKATKLTKICSKYQKRKKAIAVVGNSIVKKIYGPAYSGKKIFVLEYFLTLCICKDRKNCRDNVRHHCT